MEIFRRAYPVTGFPGTYVRSLSVAEGRKLFDSARDDETSTRSLIALSLCDESGKLVLTGPEDPRIEDLPIDLTHAIFEQAVEVNKLTAPKASPRPSSSSSD